MTGVKSRKQRTAELKTRRKLRKIKAARKLEADRQAFRDAVGPPAGGAPVNETLLAPHSPLDVTPYMRRGTYIDVAFVCQVCGRHETWTATQQKWWYEIAKGGVWTMATRCRPCRRTAREQAARHKAKTEEGRIRKAALKAAGKWRTGL